MIFMILLVILIVSFLYLFSSYNKRNIKIEGYEGNCKFVNLTALPKNEIKNIIGQLKQYANKELTLRTNTPIHFTGLVINNIDVLEIVEMNPNGNCYIQECSNKCVCENYKTFDKSKLFNIIKGDIRIRTKPGTKLSLIAKGFIKMQINFEAILKGANAKIETNSVDKFVIRELDYESIEILHPSPKSIFTKLFHALPQGRLKQGINEEVLNIVIPLINKPNIKYIS